MDEYPLSEKQIESYQHDGYIQLHDVLTAEELRRIRAAVDEVTEANIQRRQAEAGGLRDYDRVFLQMVNLWRVHDTIREYVFSPKLAGIARRLARTPRVRLWHDHALVKLPGDSKPSPWHQDLPYWPMNESGSLSCWMALDDVSVQNGCMQFIPGSHLWGSLPPINLSNPQDIFQYVPDKEKVEPKVMAMSAGSCTFHNGLTFHYASSNQTDRPRRAMITIYMPEGITYREQRHIVTDGLGLKPGELIARDLFPVLSEG